MGLRGDCKDSLKVASYTYRPGHFHVHGVKGREEWHLTNLVHCQSTLSSLSWPTSPFIEHTHLQVPAYFTVYPFYHVWVLPSHPLTCGYEVMLRGLHGLANPTLLVTDALLANQPPDAHPRWLEKSHSRMDSIAGTWPSMVSLGTAFPCPGHWFRMDRWPE